MRPLFFTYNKPLQSYRDDNHFQRQKKNNKNYFTQNVTSFLTASKLTNIYRDFYKIKLYRPAGLELFCYTRF